MTRKTDVPAGAAGAVMPGRGPVGAERVGLFGGACDPPTRAHAVVGSRARDLGAGAGAWLVFVPASRSPFKDAAPTPDRHRLAMTERMAVGIERAAVWGDELARASGGSPSYWVETLRRAHAVAPHARLWFILGADQAAAFHRWREPREILALAQPIVVLREPIVSVERLLGELAAAGFWTDQELAEWCGSAVELPPIAGSATEAREVLASRGVDDPSVGRMLDAGVLAYIRENGLYG